MSSSNPCKSEDSIDVENFRQQCLLWAFDYLHQRHADLDFNCVKAEMVCDDSWEACLRKRCGEQLVIEAKRMEHQRKIADTFPLFKNTIEKLEAATSADGISCQLADDMMHVIYRWKSTNCSWENLMLTILMTVEFVRHCANGRMGLDYIRQLFEGLSTVILRLGQAVSKLASWQGFIKLYQRPTESEMNCEPCGSFDKCSPRPCGPVCRPACPPPPCQPCPPCPPVCLPLPCYTPVCPPAPCYPPVCPPTPCYPPVCPPAPCRPPPQICQPYCEPACPEVQSCLRFSVEGRELAIDLLQCITGRSLAHLSQISYEKRQCLQRRMQLIRILADDKCNNRIAAVPGLLTRLSYAYSCYKKCPQELSCKIKDILESDVLELACSHGWQAVWAVFVVVKDLANLAKCEPCQAEILSAIVDAVYGVFMQNESIIVTVLGSWADFERYYQCRL